MCPSAAMRQQVSRPLVQKPPSIPIDDVLAKLPAARADVATEAYGEEILQELGAHRTSRRIVTPRVFEPATALDT